MTSSMFSIKERNIIKENHFYAAALILKESISCPSIQVQEILLPTTTIHPTPPQPHTAYSNTYTTHFRDGFSLIPAAYVKNVQGENTFLINNSNNDHNALMTIGLMVMMTILKKQVTRESKWGP